MAPPGFQSLDVSCWNFDVLKSIYGCLLSVKEVVCK